MISQRLRLSKHLIQRFAIIESPVHDDCVNPLSISDVFQRVSLKQNQVGQFALLNRSQLLIQPKELCRVQSCGPQAFGRSETGLDEQEKFVMQAEARETIWITCICSRKKRNACPTHVS